MTGETKKWINRGGLIAMSVGVVASVKGQHVEIKDVIVLFEVES